MHLNGPLFGIPMATSTNALTFLSLSRIDGRQALFTIEMETLGPSVSHTTQ